jgi:hypothetical protein
MNNFNKVFSVIKNQCEKQKSLAEISSFETVAKEAGVSMDRLPVYLNHLQDIGLIKYSVTDKYIYLTSLGQKQQSLINMRP